MTDFSKYTVAFLYRDADGYTQEISSGVLINFLGYHLIASAAHCADDTRNKKLVKEVFLYYGQAKVDVIRDWHNLTGRSWYLKDYLNSGSSFFDVAVTPILCPKTLTSAGKEFFPLPEGALTGLEGSDYPVVIYGFPASKMIYPEDDCCKDVTLTPVMCESDVRYWNNKSYFYTFKPDEFLETTRPNEIFPGHKGFSGGGLWKKRQETDKYALIGIISECDELRSEGITQNASATKIEHWMNFAALSLGEMADKKLIPPADGWEHLGQGCWRKTG